MANTALDIQKQLLNDDAARKAFAANPAKFLADNNIKLPANVTAPASIPLDVVETQIGAMKTALEEKGMDITDLPVNDPSAMTKFIEDTIPLKTSDLQIANGLQATLIGQQGPGSVETGVAGVVAVVVAVVAVPVAVFGKTMQGVDEMVQGIQGVTGISRVGNSFTLHAPGGVSVEGLDSAGVVNVIKGLRQ
jgi:hypothetical protein